jgi:hypothetical protein
MLRKSRSQILYLAGACRSGAIDLLCAVIPRKSSAATFADNRLSNWSEPKLAKKPDGGRTENTARRIAVEPSIGNRAGSTACGRKNWLQPRNLLSKKRWLKHHSRQQRARVIQTGQKIIAGRNLLAGGRAACPTGLSIRERLIKKSVVPYAITLCVRRSRASRGTTSRAVTWGQSPLPTACRSSWPSRDRVPSLGLSSRWSYDVEPLSPSKVIVKSLY